MKRVLISGAIILCASFTGYAQNKSDEAEVKEFVEARHKLLTMELTKSFPQGINPFDAKDLKTADNSKQFFLDPKNHNYKDLWASGTDVGTIKSVAKNLSKNVTNKKLAQNKKLTVTVVDFPEKPVNYKEKLIDKKKKIYEAETMMDVRVEVSREGVPPSIAKNELILKWEVKNSKLTLKSIHPKFETGFFASEKQQMKEKAEGLIKDYYQNLSEKRADVPAEWRDRINNSLRIEPSAVDVTVSESNVDLIIKVTNAPAVKIYADPAPYMTEDISHYSTHEAYYTVPLTFEINFNPDLTDVKLTPYFGTANFKHPELKPKEDDKREDPPLTRVESGKIFKVQILAHVSNHQLDVLIDKFNVQEKVEVEKFGRYYKYVISLPAGSKLQDANQLKQEMIDNGIWDAWVTVYENGARVRPADGKPDIN
jgi:hypothetical protein